MEKSAPTHGMKRKTIVKIIREKIEYWLKSITDESLRDAIREDYCLTGGAIASMLLGEPPNDYDIYFQSMDVATRVTNYYVDKFKKEQSDKGIVTYNNVVVQSDADAGRVYIRVASAGMLEDGQDGSSYQFFEMQPPQNLEAYLEKMEQKKSAPQFGVAFMTGNAITLYDGIQIIIRFVGAPSEIHKNFDFVHCLQYYTEKEGLVLNVDSMAALMAKELRYVGSLYPVCSIFRIKKYLARGFSITAGEMTKIAFDISRLDMTDIGVLREQLTGIDSAYFHEVLSILSENSDKDIDRTYLMSIIDRVFD